MLNPLWQLVGISEPCELYLHENWRVKRSFESKIIYVFRLESVGKEYGGLRCPPGQVWAANKNPRCALSFSDAVYEKERPDCAQKPSPKTADFACICPCKRKYLLTFNIDYDITENENLISSRNTECQLCRSEKQILIHGLNLSATDTKKCERTIRRDTKAWLASGEF